MRQVRAGLRQPAAPAAARPGDKWHLDEVFVGVNGRWRYLWRAVDQHGNVLDFLSSHAETRWRPSDSSAADELAVVPRVLVTDKLGSYRSPTASSCRGWRRGRGI